jgi:putative toxin-antitoxin system antitoxin component (TIGR02293 family)
MAIANLTNKPLTSNPLRYNTLEQTADRFNRFNRITQQAINLFEDTDRALKWLQTPKDSLAGITPLVAISTDEGAKQVEEILYRTEYGIYG